MQNKLKKIKLKKKNVQFMLSTSLVSVAICTALYANQSIASEKLNSTMGVKNADVANKIKAKSPLTKRFIIKYKNNSNISLMNADNSNKLAAAEIKNEVLTLGGKIKSQFENINVISAELSNEDADAIRLKANVEYVEEDLQRRFMSQKIPYGIGLVQADLVDDTPASKDQNGKNICIIDSGLHLPHEDMGTQGDTITGTNDSGTGNWFDHGGPHGTHVAGTIAALNNGIGVRGVIGSNPNLHIVKVFNDAGWGYSSSLMNAVDICKNNGADVINMSLGGPGSSSFEQAGFKEVFDSGVLVVAAAGNDGSTASDVDYMLFPASYDSVMSVAAIDKTKNLAGFSQKNDQVEISAPGVNITSAYPTGLGSVVELSVGGIDFNANSMENNGEITAPLYNFSMGKEIDNNASGYVCLIQRGDISFKNKVQNCEDSGGLAAIIFNNEPGNFTGTLVDGFNSTSIPSVTVSQADGTAMMNQVGQDTRVFLGPGDYGAMSGTSMASPHVAGVAALVWSHYPNCTNSQIRNILNASALDLGDTGYDIKYGHGLVQAKDAIDLIASQGCDGNGEIPPTNPPIDTVMKNGVAKTNLSSDDVNDAIFTFDVPENAIDIKIESIGGTGEGQMFVKFDSEPTSNDYECQLNLATGYNELCPNLTKDNGTYFISLRSNTSFENVSIKASFTTEVVVEDSVLINGVTKTKLTTQSVKDKVFTFIVPEDASDIKVTVNGGTGDADLYVKSEGVPSNFDNDCRSTGWGNDELCELTQTGTTYFVVLDSFESFSDVNLTASYNTQSEPVLQPINETFNDVDVDYAQWSRFTYQLPEGYKNLKVSISGGEGDADLFLSYSRESSKSDYDCRPYKIGNEELCTVTAPASGLWHIDLNGYSKASGITINVQADIK